MPNGPPILAYVWRLLAMAALALCALAAPAHGAVLDSNWGTGGIRSVTTSSERPSNSYGLALQPDGKQLYVIEAANDGVQVMAVVRRTASGAPDTTFGGGDGSVLITPASTIQSSYHSATAAMIHVMPDSRIVVITSATNGALTIYVLTSTGALDTSVDGSGIRSLGRGPMSGFTSVTRPVGSVVAGPRLLVLTEAYGAAVGRMPRLVSIDTTTLQFEGGFGVGGAQSYDLVGGVDEHPMSFALQSSGRVVMSGYTDHADGQTWLAAVDSTTGNLDATFGAANVGYTFTNWVSGDNELRQMVAVDGSDRLMIAIDASSGADRVVRATSDGELDGTWGTGGTVTTTSMTPRGAIVEPVTGDTYVLSFNGNWINRLVRVTAAGAASWVDPTSYQSIVSGIVADPVSGFFFSGGSSQGIDEAMAATAYRWASTGTGDPAFGSTGMQVIDGEWNGGEPADFDSVECVPVSGGGVACAAALSSPFLGSSWTRIAVWRLLPDSTMDPAFGTAGMVTVAPLTELALPVTGIRQLGIVEDSANRVVVVANTGNVNRHLLAYRFLSDGSPDTTFGGGDGREAWASGSIMTPDDLGLLADDSLVVLINGTSMVRILVGGTLDATFGGTGSVSIGLRGSSIDIDGLNRIVVAGETTSTPRSVQLQRYSASGSIDPSFASSGTLTWDVSAGLDDGARAVRIDSSGRIVLAGYLVDATMRRPMVARVDASDAPDATFGATGIGFTAFGGGAAPDQEYLYGLELLADGRIIVAGATSGREPLLGRVSSAGVADLGFHADGMFRGLAGTIYGRSIFALGPERYAIAGDFWAGSAAYSGDTAVVTTLVPPDVPSLQAPVDMANTTDTTPQLEATFSDANGSDTGTVTFEICTMAMSAGQECLGAGGTVVASGSSPGGIVNGTNGAWTSPTLVVDDSYYWHARSTDQTGRTSAWSASRSFTVASTASVVLDVSDVNLGPIVAGADTFTTVVASVSTNDPDGYTLISTDESDIWSADCVCGSTIPDWTGTSAAPTVWSAATPGYAGITVRDTTGTTTNRLSKWGTANPSGWAEADIVNNRYAGLKLGSTTALHATSSAAASDTVTMTWRANVGVGQVAGSYEASLSVTVVGNP